MPEVMRFRFAPSPTGFLHIGGVRTALFNWLLAKQSKGQFVLRIEDTDKERSTQESIDAILDGMKWLGLDWDEGPNIGGEYGPYFQSQRFDIYQKYITELLDTGKAYRCFCSKEELDGKRKLAEEKKENYIYDRTCLNLSEEEIQKNLEQKKPFVIRLKVEPQNIGFTDLIRGPIDFKKYTFDDFIMVRPDTTPVYNFAVVIDDALMHITHVLRGDDHISNTPRQILIYRALGLPIPEFAHLPMILGADGSRLSKRHGATAVQQYKEEGYLPQTLINFLAKLGWSYDDAQEIFSINELIEKFSLDKVSKNPAVFNIKKLLWMNGEYIKNLSLKEKYELCKPYFIKSGFFTEIEYKEKQDYVFEVLELVGDRLKLLSDISTIVDFLFKETIDYVEKDYNKFIKQEFVPAFFESLIAELESLSDFNNKNIETVFLSIIEKMGLHTGKAMQAVRVGIVGRASSPDLVSSIVLLGKEISLQRLKKIITLES